MVEEYRSQESESRIKYEATLLGQKGRQFTAQGAAQRALGKAKKEP